MTVNGYPTDEPCDICGSTEDIVQHPRFYYPTCQSCEAEVGPIDRREARLKFEQQRLYRYDKGSKVEVDVITSYIDNGEPRWRRCTIQARAGVNYENIPSYVITLDDDPKSGTWNAYEDRLRDIP